MAVVAGLYCYPVKGCAGVSMSGAMVTLAGLQHDRTFMVIGRDGVFRNQRRHPRLAVIHPEVSADGARLTLRAEHVEPMEIDVDLESPRREVLLAGVPFRGIDQGDLVADWLSQVLGVSSRLVRVPPEHDRITDGQTPGTSGYADSSPIHITSVASLVGLNARIADRGDRPVPMSRFRPNIVIDGWDEPHVEDRARRVRVGDAVLGYSKIAIRCAVTLVDQTSAVTASPEPLRTLADYRRAARGGVAFGVKFSVLQQGRLSLGDQVTVETWGSSELART